MRYECGGLIFGGAYTRRGLFSEFYSISVDIRFNSVIVFIFNVSFNVFVSKKRSASLVEACFFDRSEV